jgi:hypothetical protein
MSEQMPSNLTLVSPGATPGINPWFVAVTVTIAAFIELLDTSIAKRCVATHWRRTGTQLR